MSAPREFPHLMPHGRRFHLRTHCFMRLWYPFKERLDGWCDMKSMNFRMTRWIWVPFLVCLILCGCGVASNLPHQNSDGGAGGGNSSVPGIGTPSGNPSDERGSDFDGSVGTEKNREKIQTETSEPGNAQAGGTLTTAGPEPVSSGAIPPAESGPAPEDGSKAGNGPMAEKGSMAENGPTAEDETAVTGRTICLTFDDGPAWNNTPKVLKALKDAGVKATFFVCGPDTEDRRRLIKEAYDDGHVIGLHGMSHALRKLYASEASFFADFDALERMVTETTGETPTLYRFPGGSNNSFLSPELVDTIVQKLIERGYEYDDWNVLGQDESRPDPEVIAQHVVDACRARRGAKTASIVLLHDSEGRYTTGDAVPQILKTLQEEGYSFSPITPAIAPIHFARK